MNRALLFAAWVVIVWGLAQAKPFLIPLLLAALLAFLMSPLVAALRRRKFPEWAAVAIGAALLFLPALALTALLGGEVASLLHEYPQHLASMKAKWAEFASSSIVERLNLSEFLDTESLTERLGSQAERGVTFALESLKTLAETGAHLVVTLFFAVLMIAARTQLRRGAEKLVADAPTLDEIVTLIEKFLMARIGIAIIVALLDMIILKALGSHYSVIFGCLLGASTFIPIIGFLVGVLPPLVLSIATGHPPLRTGLMVLLTYLVSTIEAHFVTPKYLGHQLNLNLLATFVALFAGELLWGVWGMVLAIPLMGVVRILLATSGRHEAWAELLAEREKG